MNVENKTIVCPCVEMKKRYQHYMDVAAAMADKKSDVVCSKHGCVLVGDRGKIMRIKSNRCTRNFSAQRGSHGTYHAEERAVFSLPAHQRRRVRAVYVTIIPGNHCRSNPCERCQRALKHLPNARVFYTV